MYRDPRNRENGQRPMAYEIALQFDVRNAATLWRAAARRLEEYGLERFDIHQTIGSIEDPSISDCLSTLILPRHADGCSLIDVHIQPGQRAEDMFPADIPAMIEH